MKKRVDGILFDKDGTLFDFHTTWGAWARTIIEDLAARHAVPVGNIADEIHYDLAAGQFLRSSPIIAGTNRQAAECVARAIPGADIGEIERFLMRSAAHAPLAPAVPLAPFLTDLRGRGLTLGVMTNDTEFGARAHLATAGVEGLFDFIAGFDSGHGSKPAPEPLWAFAKAHGLAPARVVMVGDSAHDLIAGRAAGMQTLAVLTGVAGHDDLSALADAVLPDIGHIPAWLDA